MIHLKAWYLFLIICFVPIIQTTSLSLPGCPEKCGDLAIPFPFGLTSECCFDETFHIFCDTSFDPPKPLLRLLHLEVVSISLDGKMELLNSSLVGLAEKEGYQILPTPVEWAAGDLECNVAQQNGGRYACRSRHSQCTDSNTGQGHICRCLPGFQGNPYLADGCQDIDECAVSNPCVDVCVNLRGSFKCYCPKGLVGDGRKDGTSCYTQHQTNLSTPRVLSLIAIVVVASILAITFGTYMGKRENRVETQRMTFFEQNGGNLLQRKQSRRNPKLEIYDTEKIDSITGNFHDEIVTLRCKPGVKFHRGTLPNTNANTGPVQVVVATVERVPEDQREHFVDQLIFLATPHRNLVRILGCCLDKPCPLIVYEHHGDGGTTLSNFTNTMSPNAGFSREMRLKAAVGVAKGLAHFNSHKPWSPTPVHGNICSANIMMDGSYDPKIFYAAGSNLITRGASTSGDVYRDPKFQNKRSDVYSFGVLLVELLTKGRAAIPPNTANSIIMAQANRLLEIVDGDMIGQGEVVRGVATLANKCLNVDPENRPNMKNVSIKLANLIQMG